MKLAFKISALNTHETVGLPEGTGIFWHIPPARGERDKSTCDRFGA